MEFSWTDITARDQTSAESMSDSFKNIAVDLSDLYSQIHDINTTRNQDAQWTSLELKFMQRRIENLRLQRELNEVIGDVFSHVSRNLQIAELQALTTLLNGVSHPGFEDTVSSPLGYTRSVSWDFADADLAWNTDLFDITAFETPEIDSPFLTPAKSTTEVTSRIYVDGNARLGTKLYLETGAVVAEVDSSDRFQRVIDNNAASRGVVWSYADTNSTYRDGAIVHVELPSTNNPNSNFLQVNPYPQAGVNITQIDRWIGADATATTVIDRNNNYYYRKQWRDTANPTVVDGRYLNHALTQKIYMRNAAANEYEISIEKSDDNFEIYGLAHIDVGVAHFVATESHAWLRSDTVADAYIKWIDDIIIEGSYLDNLEIELYTSPKGLTLNGDGTAPNTFNNWTTVLSQLENDNADATKANRITLIYEGSEGGGTASVWDKIFWLKLKLSTTNEEIPQIRNVRIKYREL